MGLGMIMKKEKEEHSKWKLVENRSEGEDLIWRSEETNNIHEWKD